jgi:hypothetical protein
MSRLAACTVVLSLLLAGCSVASSPAQEHRPPASPVTVVSHATDPAPGGDPYVDLADALHRRGVDVWFETDLVARWLDGPAVFAKTLQRLGTLARVPGFAGFKVADELGYGDGLDSPQRVQQFLDAADAGLARVAPGSRLLVDAIVPELGCLPGRGPAQDACAADARTQHPAATATAMTGYLRSGDVDVLDLSTGLLEPSTYARWGLTPAQAQAAAWGRVRSLGWAGLTTLQARKALADAGGYQGSAQQARQDTATFVDAPTAAGAAAVDIWTWRQPYDGRTVSLLADGLLTNPLWDRLVAARARGVHLFTHMTPSAMPTHRAAFSRECDAAATVFDAVFVAAGTG